MKKILKSIGIIVMMFTLFTVSYSAQANYLPGDPPIITPPPPPVPPPPPGN